MEVKVDVKPANLARAILFFDSMLTPKFITLLYWLALAGVVFSGWGTMNAWGGVSFASFCSGLGVILGGAVAVRIGFELLIVIFKIHDNIAKIANK